ncbi:hypothetical protein, partial [Rhizobium sp. SAFR-030]|uniref:hypothetical protein n=1 Tax=Rhizobium sp. SAFR-030 TaxID=3387277 RepID=UPI003F7F494F
HHRLDQVSHDRHQPALRLFIGIVAGKEKQTQHPHPPSLGGRTRLFYVHLESVKTVTDAEEKWFGAGLGGAEASDWPSAGGEPPPIPLYCGARVPIARWMASISTLPWNCPQIPNARSLFT